MSASRKLLNWVLPPAEGEMPLTGPEAALVFDAKRPAKGEVTLGIYAMAASLGQVNSLNMQSRTDLGQVGMFRLVPDDSSGGPLASKGISSIPYLFKGIGRTVPYADAESRANKINTILEDINNPEKLNRINRVEDLHRRARSFAASGLICIAAATLLTRR